MLAVSEQADLGGWPGEIKRSVAATVNDELTHASPVFRDQPATGHQIGRHRVDPTSDVRLLCPRTIRGELPLVWR